MQNAKLPRPLRQRQTDRSLRRLSNIWIEWPLVEARNELAVCVSSESALGGLGSGISFAAG